jgi:hypothetical protein
MDQRMKIRQGMIRSMITSTNMARHSNSKTNRSNHPSSHLHHCSRKMPYGPFGRNCSDWTTNHDGGNTGECGEATKPYASLEQ